MSGQMNLADGSTWGIFAGDRESCPLIASFKDAMQLRPLRKPAKRLLVVTDKDGALPMPAEGEGHLFAHHSSEEDDTFVCSLSPAENGRTFAVQLKQLSLMIAQYAQTLGGLLLHGALAEWQGQGVIFAGRPGIGKTTLSQRLVSPWRSLCDDLTLVVLDLQGRYWAHPWPTWSRFLPGRSGGSWDVHQAVPLKRIFFLAQSQNDRIETIGRAHAVGLLTRAWSQASFGVPAGIDDEQRHALRLKGFETICRITRDVPGSLLHLSLDGAFRQELERELA